VPETPENGFTILTNGVVSHGGPAGNTDNLDTFNGDNTGVMTDFVGLQYDSSNRFDTITIELGNQFGDGGDWDTMPRVFILNNRTLVNPTVTPELSANWVEVFGATETSGHTFSPVVTPGAGGTIVLNLTGIPANQRTGWGWAVGGVDGNANASGIINFISVTEASATGAAAPAPAVIRPATPAPVNVVSNVYHSVARNGEHLGDGNLWRSDAFASMVNGVVFNGTPADDGFDTFQGDGGGTQTDFVGLQYSSIYRFDTLTVDLGNQFVDGGDWDSPPRIFILKNPVDTNQTRPETDPTNWVELTGAMETTGHTFSPVVSAGAGGIMTFNLSSIPADQRTGYGWAIGGVDGNAVAVPGGQNFISVTELDATGALVPGPYDLELEVSSTGEVKIVNDSPFDISLDRYEIRSPSGSLNFAAWNSLQDATPNPGQDTTEFPRGTGVGDGWEELGNFLGNDVVAEAYLEDSSTLASDDDPISLGNLFSPGGTQDLSFQYRTPDGAFIDALVRYVTGAAVAGDYNSNGIVDAADYVIWRKRLGPGSLPNEGGISPGVVDTADYNFWRSRFGATSGSGAALGAGSVPEPDTLLLCLGSAIVGILFTARRSQDGHKPGKRLVRWNRDSQTVGGTN
jgi:hypothetical protein